MTISIVLMSLIAMSVALSTLLNTEAHLSGKNLQDWTNKKRGIFIQFTYEPEQPIIDTFTELKFSVQNITTGEHIPDLVGRIVVTNGQRLFKFENISIPDGDFSVKYLFPDDGTHQVLLRLDGSVGPQLASFNVFVPHQSPPTLLDPFIQEDKRNVTFTIIAAIAATVPLLIFYFRRKK
jgi:hypothetical protein